MYNKDITNNEGNKMKYALQNIETGDIVKTYASMREFLNDFPKGLDEDNRKTFKIINL